MSLKTITLDDLNTPEVKKSGYVSIYRPIAGWKAIKYWWNNEEKDLGGFWEPWNTGNFTNDDKSLAIADAKLWAECEDIPYLENTGTE